MRERAAHHEAGTKAPHPPVTTRSGHAGEGLRALSPEHHNQYLEATLGQHYNLALRIWSLFFDRLPDVTAHVGEHADLLKVVIAGDGEQADRIAVAHVDHFEQAFRQAI